MSRLIIKLIYWRWWILTLRFKNSELSHADYMMNEWMKKTEWKKMSEKMNEWKNEWKNKRKNKRMNENMNETVNERINEQSNEWMNESD